MQQAATRSLFVAEEFSPAFSSVVKASAVSAYVNPPPFSSSLVSPLLFAFLHGASRERVANLGKKWRGKNRNELGKSGSKVCIYRSDGSERRGFFAILFESFFEFFLHGLRLGNR